MRHPLHWWRTIPPLILFLLPVGLGAHPHVFVDSRVIADFNGGELSHVTAHWTFDRFFTHSVLRDFDLDMSGEYSKAQIEEVRRGAFENLERHNYFIYVNVDGEDIASNNPRNFDVTLDRNDQLVYTFEIPVGVDVRGGGVTVEVAMYDEEYFVDMVFADDYLVVDGSTNVDLDHTIEDSVYDTGIWGPMIRERVVMDINGVR
ncbi:MAG: DUF1007 family protein [Spirochaetales bacterium]